LPERPKYFAQFIDDYQTIRAQEKRGSADSAYYRALPFQDLTSQFTSDWRIRAISYSAFLKQVLSPLEKSFGSPLRVLDIGAGNGWLSNRLAERGHALAAVDLQTNPTDGLGAYVHYSTSFLKVQAEADHLPFLPGTIDLVIYNASFHYSEDYGKTLAAALQVLAPRGQIVILDTPLYQSEVDGQQMVRERLIDFERRFGRRSDALHSENFLTPSRLAELAQDLSIQWRSIAPFYSWRWHLRPWLARLRGRRAPARFAILVAQTRY
jgi:SAM-dependent methyltransferase